MFSFHCLVYPQTFRTVQYILLREVSVHQVQLFLSSSPVLCLPWPHNGRHFVARVSLLLIKLNPAVWVGPGGTVLRQCWLQVRKAFISITSVDGVEMEYNTTNGRKEKKPLSAHHKSSLLRLHLSHFLNTKTSQIFTSTSDTQVCC